MKPDDILKWKGLIEARGRKITEISSKIRSRSYLSTLFAAAAEAPNKMPQPTAETVKKLATELQLPIGVLMGEKPLVELSPPSEGYHQLLHQQAERIFSDVLNLVHSRLTQNGHRPSVESILSWWRSTGGRLSDSGNISQAFDLIEIPSNETNKVTPHRVGECSMAGAFFEEDRTARLQRVVDNMSREGQASLASSYRMASQKNEPIFSQQLTLMVSSPESEMLEINYIRLQLPVSASNGTPFIASYCFPI